MTFDDPPEGEIRQRVMAVNRVPHWHARDTDCPYRFHCSLLFCGPDLAGTGLYPPVPVFPASAMPHRLPVPFPLLATVFWPRPGRYRPVPACTGVSSQRHAAPTAGTVPTSRYYFLAQPGRYWPVPAGIGSDRLHKVSFSSQVAPRQPRPFFWKICLSIILPRSHDIKLNSHTPNTPTNLHRDSHMPNNLPATNPQPRRCLPSSHPSLSLHHRTCQLFRRFLRRPGGQLHSFLLATKKTIQWRGPHESQVPPTSPRPSRPRPSHLSLSLHHRTCQLCRGLVREPGGHLYSFLQATKKTTQWREPHRSQLLPRSPRRSPSGSPPRRAPRSPPRSLPRSPLQPSQL
jgi:hypothetical protein